METFVNVHPFVGWCRFGSRVQACPGVRDSYFFSTAIRLSPGLRSISLLYGSMPANVGFSLTTNFKRLFFLGNAVLGQL